MSQTIFRVQKSQNFTVISNVPINDKSLSPGALGVLTYLLSKPDNWVVFNREVQARFNIGRKQLDGILTELKQAGYIERKRFHDGLKIKWETHVFELPKEQLSHFGTIGAIVPKGSSTKGSSTKGSSTKGNDTKWGDIPSPDLPSPDVSSTDVAGTEGESLSLSLPLSLSEMAISIWSELADCKATKFQKRAIKEFVETIGTFDIDTWRASVKSAVMGGCKAGNLDAIFNTFQWGDGDYKTWQEMRRLWPDNPEMWEMEREDRNGNGKEKTWYTDEEGKLILR